MLRVLLLAFCIGGYGCGSTSAPQLVERTDSSGIAVVISHRPAWGDETPWSLTPRPTLDLGSSYDFFRVVAATRIESGVIAVGSLGTSEVLFFSPSGELLGKVGRPGDGPGEFRRMSSLHPLGGDSVLVFEAWNRRMTIVSPPATVHRVQAVDVGSLSLDELYVLDNRILAVRGISLAEMETLSGAVRVPQHVVRVDGNGRRGDPVLVAAGLDMFLRDGNSATVPFAKASQVAAGPAGLYVGDADGMAFRVHSVDGRVRMIARAPGYPLSIPTAERAEVASALRRQGGLVEELADLIPDHRPAYSDMIVDADGFVWLAAYHGLVAPLSDEPRRWIIFDPSGAWLGEFLLPANFDAYEIGPDYILGRQRDAMGVESVQLLGLRRPTD